MRVSYPWKFKSENYHIRIILKENINLKQHFNICDNKYFDVSTNEVLLTFSNVISSINEEDYIKYHEFIVKCKVNYKGNIYYHPLITFVDNAYSIIRGYYLGFEKEIANINVSNNVISVENDSIKFDIDTRLKKKEKTYEAYPFILVKNYKFDNNTKANEVVTLDSGDYLRIKEKSFEISANDNIKILKAVGISTDIVLCQENYYIEDEFVLGGIRRI